MTFNPAVPLNSDSPSIFPSQNQTNMARLQKIIESDHQFNLTAASDDGYHNLIRMTEQAPAGMVSGFGRSYVKTSAGRLHQFFMDQTGASYQITPTMPIRAAVNFNGIGAVGPLPIANLRSVYNVSGVNKIATGDYIISFATPMPDNNYIVQITGMLPSNNPVSACVKGNATYGNAVTTVDIRVIFFNPSGVNIDVLMGNVTIFSVT